jgi:hypothetical protein
MYPGTNWVSRDKKALTNTLLSGIQDKPVGTFDCGGGNAYFYYLAHRAQVE